MIVEWRGRRSRQCVCVIDESECVRVYARAGETERAKKGRRGGEEGCPSRWGCTFGSKKKDDKSKVGKGVRAE